MPGGLWQEKMTEIMGDKKERMELILQDFQAGYGGPVISTGTVALASGTLTGLVGKNGCGKSTLLKGLLGMCPFVRGHCSLEGEELLKVSAARRTQIVSMLPQVLEAPEGIAVADVLEMALLAGMPWWRGLGAKEKAAIREIVTLLGLESVVGQEFHTLSQGQKQLVLWGRMLLQDTPVVLLDEPDSALDFTNRHSLLARLRQWIHEKERIGLVVLHDPGYAMTYCDAIIGVKNGRLLEETLVLSERSEETAERAAGYLGQLYPGIRVHRWEDGYLAMPESKTGEGEKHDFF